jgi:pyrroline-5-carboxylate reductase
VASLADTQITLIGGGTMAEALVRGLLSRELTAPDRITIGEPLADRRAHLASALGVGVVENNADAAAGADVVVLAVKPQVVGTALPPLRGALRHGALVLSIMAGVRIATLESILGAVAIVRAMPNTPGQVGEGIAAWTRNPAVTAAQAEQARAILGALGDEVEVPGEDYVDMATAVSGSGPAYVFLFLEALVDAGVQLGLARPVAERLALQTVRGAAGYAQRSPEHLAVLRNLVTSPGGTTAEGLFALEQGGLRAAVTQAVLAAYRKARVLGGIDTE